MKRKRSRKNWIELTLEVIAAGLLLLACVMLPVGCAALGGVL